MGPNGGTMGSAGTAVIGADGTWRVRDVPPGEYILRATGTVAGGTSETAAMPVEVQGIDLEGLIVRADPGAIISGRLVTDNGEPLPATARPAVGTTPLSMLSGVVRPTAGQDDGVVEPDGRFTRKTASGPVVIRPYSLPHGWVTRSIEIGGRDYAGMPVELRPGQPLNEVTIVISNRLPALSGRVVSPDGQTAEATVLLFSTDAARWFEAGANQRTARPDQSGAYRFEALRPGDYYVIALERMQTWQMNDPEFLAAQQKRAVKVTMRESAETRDLKVVR